MVILVISSLESMLCWNWDAWQPTLLLLANFRKRRVISLDCSKGYQWYVICVNMQPSYLLAISKWRTVVCHVFQLGPFNYVTAINTFICHKVSFVDSYFKTMKNRYYHFHCLDLCFLPALFAIFAASQKSRQVMLRFEW